MAQPTPYDRQYSFQNFQAANGDSPLPGHEVDGEFNSVKITFDEILANIAKIQRDDGRLKNGSVGLDQLDASINLGMRPPSPWETATSYAILDSVFQLGVLYRCIVPHTSGTFATDLAGGKWVELADLAAVPIASASQLDSDPSGDVEGDDVQAAIDELAILDEQIVASATTADIGESGKRKVFITGTTGITSFGSTPKRHRLVRFEDKLTLTHSGALSLPGGKDIYTEAGDAGIFVSDEIGNWRCLGWWPSVSAAEVNVASAAMCNIGAADAEQVNITGTVAITSLGSVKHRTVRVRFAASLVLTYNATTLILPTSGDIVTEAGDTALMRSDASGNWRCLFYQRAHGRALVNPIKTEVTVLPIGARIGYCGASAPSLWLFCYGQAVSRATYALLFDVIGTQYGSGNGSTTFNLPDYRGRTSVGKDDMGGAAANRVTNAASGITATTLGAVGGAQTHTLTRGELPAVQPAISISTDPGHVHTLTAQVTNNQGAGTGFFAGAAVTSDAIGTSNSGSHNHTASIENLGSGQAHNNMPPVIVENVIIYAGV